MKKIFYVTILLFSFGCKKDITTAPISPSQFSKDSWTKVADVQFDPTDGYGFDYLITDKDKALLYMDRQYFYRLDSNFNITSQYKFIDNDNIPYNSFMNQYIFWNVFGVNKYSSYEQCVLQQFLISSNQLTYNYYGQQLYFNDTSNTCRYFILSLIWQNSYNCFYTVLRRQSNTIGNQVSSYKIYNFNAFSPYANFPITLPDSTIPIGQAINLNGNIYVMGTHCYIRNGLNFNQVSDIPKGYTYKWIFNNRAFFINTSVGGPIMETSDGVTFKETISGLRVSLMCKPLPNGYAFCDKLNSQDSIVLLNLNNNTSKNIDLINGPKDDGISPSVGINAGICTSDNKLILMGKNGIYVRLLN